MTTDSTIRPLHFGKLLPPPYGGLEGHIDSLLRSLQPTAQGTLLATGNPADASARAAEFPYRVIAQRAYGHFASVPLAPGIVNSARRELASGCSNLLHLHAPNPLGDLAGLTCSADVPVVMSWHSDVVRQRSLLRLYGPIQRRIIDRSDRIVVATPKHFTSSAQLQRPGVEQKIRVVPFGLDFDGLGADRGDPATTERLDHFASDRHVLLTVGRHVYYKGYEFLLAAVAKMRWEAVLVMVGTGPFSDALKRQAVEMGIADRVLFLGQVNHAALVAAYHRCDVFALPSIEPSEAFGIASAEAMACGKPTVVCELHNGVNHLNQSGLTSLTVPPRDVPALADALDTLLSDGALRERMGREASHWVRGQFSMTAMREGTLAVYRSLR